MASYEYLGGQDEIFVVSEDITQPGQRVTARAIASQVVYSLLFHPWPTDPAGNTIWTPEAIDTQLEEWAVKWNENAAVPGVVSISVTQALNPAGQLKDVAVVTIASTSGLTVLTYNFFNTLSWEPDSFANNVGQYRAQQDAQETAAA